MNDTIVALATAPGVGAIAVIRLSGDDCLSVVSPLFSGKKLENQASHTVHFGNLMDGNTIVDEVLISLFVAPHSFTKENSVEISCHGSPYIVNRIIQLLVKSGARLAEPGEFTQRAYLNGRFDLAQAEAVADLIASENEAAHATALNQMRGGISNEIKNLREKLVHFASMIELELDFSEEDVEFASREELKSLIEKIDVVLVQLIDSFQLGNVIKNGVPVVIVGKPNAGKSTLLNALLEEEKAIVSDIAGTTRDIIEDELNIRGVKFRFIDTAGLRETKDQIEAIGVERAEQKMQEASLIMYLFDLSTESLDTIRSTEEMLMEKGKPYILVGNKLDKIGEEETSLKSNEHYVSISAKSKTGVDQLKELIWNKSQMDNFQPGNVVVTNSRHYQSLVNTQNSLHDVLRGIDNQITNDFLAQDIRHALHFLGEITGEITTDDLLANIFSKFCIGK
ncbi:MAG: tRNA uridine-5-carboxymethylaminomethyl(34) synthesis GTPase MnmE [Reichenbachiella sp.]|uniref:tRNA uridine-5-carboxymethylaminomethyl(34) synthesis GTPase MnmE n=1 Tax=Reichenbachiella sp. TaxID=2184521 RepID=UPI002966CD4D|nr:tRNA uridine-5-carboxymethylaminomethyl(34) synthesis GTPase MnmE [Reichenbachiella sp.]MDW3210423.1 tRNA uridine-5-carboxymethylaminomethyl(34) synthesis GTPase MnmE [Reichenbachiella sp.]